VSAATWRVSTNVLRRAEASRHTCLPYTMARRSMIFVYVLSGFFTRNVGLDHGLSDFRLFHIFQVRHIAFAVLFQEMELNYEILAVSICLHCVEAAWEPRRASLELSTRPENTIAIRCCLRLRTTNFRKMSCFSTVKSLFTDSATCMIKIIQYTTVTTMLLAFSGKILVRI
jgi:hypothetical protein